MEQLKRISATVNTDASFSFEYKKGSYAYWIGCDGKRWIGADMLRGDIQDITEAELKAIANGLYFLIEIKNPPGLHLVYINTDNLAAVNMIKHKKKESEKKKYGDILTMIHNLLENKEVVVRHVPAHTAGRSKRTHTNNKLDEMAKKQLRSHLAIHKKKDGKKNKKQSFRRTAR